MKLSSFLFGTDSKLVTKPVDRYEPWQEDLIRAFLESGGRNIEIPSIGPASLGGASDFAESVYTMLRRSLPQGEATAKALMQGKIPGAKNLTELYDQLLSKVSGSIESRFPSTSASTTLQELMQADPTAWQEYYEKVIRDPLLEDYFQKVAPALDRKYAPSGFWSSEYMRSKNLTEQELVEQLIAEGARLGYEAREAALNRALQAADVYRGYQDLWGDIGLNALGQAGAERERILHAVLGGLGYGTSMANAASGITSAQAQLLAADQANQLHAQMAELEAYTQALLQPTRDTMVGVTAGSPGLLTAIASGIGTSIGRGVGQNIGSSIGLSNWWQGGETTKFPSYNESWGSHSLDW